MNPKCNMQIIWKQEKNGSSIRKKEKNNMTKFEEKFGLPVAEIENMIGKTVMVEVKKAMGKYVYSEIKPFPKKKKENIIKG